MVSIEAIRASNAALSRLPPGLVALFVGATSGIGESTLKQFYLHTTRSRVYFVGRNETAANKIIHELKNLKPDNEITFFKNDVSLLKNVDQVCAAITQKEKKLNLLFLTPGFLSLKARDESAEGLDRKLSTNYYARLRFTQNLLPLLRTAASIPDEFARVVSVLAAGSEGRLHLEDLDLKQHFSLKSCMTHSVVMTDLAFEELAKQEPTISFVHAYPGWVKTGFFRSAGTLVNLGGKVLYALLAPWMVGFEESGERHLYAATSASYPSREGPDGVELTESMEVASGSDGVVGSGAYLLNWDGRTTGKAGLLREYREEGVGQMIWKHTLEIFERVMATS
ncbi:MAG: hypothetical protein M1830_000499 [Pleopsidium flavum]|nr:MAG: hypothetical protein M1830_000499 [Pleopsidium flavum]